MCYCLTKLTVMQNLGFLELLRLVLVVTLILLMRGISVSFQVVMKWKQFSISVTARKHDQTDVISVWAGVGLGTPSAWVRACGSDSDAAATESRFWMEATTA